MLLLDRWAFCLSLLLLLVASSSGFFGWLTRSGTPEKAPVSPAPPPDPAQLPHVPFEMTTADERFLAEARRLDLSPLDSCHHKVRLQFKHLLPAVAGHLHAVMEVVAQLRSSCTDLTEEELAKLGVSLFNCQASVEGRGTYLCTADMTLAECTAGMDPDTWNAYHIVSNRARAVCYATRQMQFKRRAEHTVNALVSTAVSQLEAMKMLKSGQEELKELTSESLQKVATSQEAILAQQDKLQGSQMQMEESIHDNLDQLVREKALIASGQQQVAELIEGITKRMENVSRHLDQQDLELQEGHRAILEDLSQVQRRAQEVYSKTETNLGLFAAYQNQTALYYEELMQKLQKINQSLGVLLNAMDQIQASVDGQLQHIRRFISWAGFSLSSIYTCVLHGSYFLLAALIMTFLQIPGLPRAVMLVLVVANALSELNQAVSLGFKSLTCLLILTVAGNGLLGTLCLCAMKGRRWKPTLLRLRQGAQVGIQEAQVEGSSRCRLTSTPDSEDEVGLLKRELEKLEDLSYATGDSHLARDSPRKGDSIFLEEGTAHAVVGWKPQRSYSPHPMSLRRQSLTRSSRHEATLEKFPHHRLDSAFNFPISRTSSPNESMASDASNCSLNPRPPCQAVTRTGHQCRKKAVPGHVFCHVHASGQSSYTSQSGACF